LVQKSGISFLIPQRVAGLLGLEILASLLQGVVLFETGRMRRVHEEVACFELAYGNGIQRADSER